MKKSARMNAALAVCGALLAALALFVSRFPVNRDTVDADAAAEADAALWALEEEAYREDAPEALPAVALTVGGQEEGASPAFLRFFGAEGGTAASYAEVVREGGAYVVTLTSISRKGRLNAHRMDLAGLGSGSVWLLTPAAEASSPRETDDALPGQTVELYLNGARDGTYLLRLSEDGTP